MERIHIHNKVLKYYLKGTSGRESELSESNVLADDIALSAGSGSDSPDISSNFCISCAGADVEGAGDGADLVFGIFAPVVGVSVALFSFIYMGSTLIVNACHGLM